MTMYIGMFALCVVLLRASKRCYIQYLLDTYSNFRVITCSISHVTPSASDPCTMPLVIPLVKACYTCPRYVCTSLDLCGSGPLARLDITGVHIINLTTNFL